MPFHIASALYADAAVIETYDGPLLACANRIALPKGAGPLLIREPFLAQGSLFREDKRRQ